MRPRSRHILVSICIIGLTFVAVAMLMGTSVLTGNTTWEVGAPPLLAPKVYVEENMPVSVDSVAGQTHEEIKAKDSQGNAGNLLPSSEPLRPNPREDQNDALSYQSMEQLKVARNANEIATRDNEIQDRLVTVGWITIVTMVLLTLAQLYFVWTANQHAAAAALAAKDSVEVADRALKSVERAYLLVGRWKPRVFQPNAIVEVDLILTNTGHTHATIDGYSFDYVIAAELPPRPTYPKTLGAQKRGVSLQPQEQSLRVLKLRALSPSEYEAVQNRSLMLYVYGCFVYTDVFCREQWIEIFVQYDMERTQFFLVDAAGYNYST